MKKILSYLLCLMLLPTLLLGCDKSDDKESNGKYVIAIVQPMDHPSLNQIRDTIVSELKSSLGDKVKVVTKNANGDASLLPQIMQDLVSDDVDMIVPIATSTAQAAASTTSDINIVFSAVSNPIEAGLVKSFDETTGNITGVSNSIPIDKIIDLATEVTPDVKTFGLIYNSSEINSVTGIEKAKEYLDKLGLKYKEATITGTADLQQAVSSLVGSVDAFFTPNDNTVASAMTTYVQLATDANIPIYVGADSMVNDGGLATVGIDYTQLGKQTAAMIKKIYDGAAIKDTPVEQISEYAKMINKDTAEKLNITVPDNIKDEFVIIGNNK